MRLLVLVASFTVLTPLVAESQSWAKRAGPYLAILDLYRGGRTRDAVEALLVRGPDAVRLPAEMTRGERLPGDPIVLYAPAAAMLLQDNGVDQRIESVMLEDVPITLMLVLDASASVKGDLLERLKDAARAATAALRPADRAGLIAFTHRVRLLATPPSLPSALGPHLDALEAEGETSVYDATFAAMALRQRTPGRTLMLVFSDGDDTASWLDPRDVLAAAQRSDIVAYAVVLNQQLRGVHPMDIRTLQTMRALFDEEPHLFGRLYLARLVEESGGSTLSASASALRDAFVRIVNDFRSRYVLTYVPQGVAARGWHGISVKVKARGGTVQARRGYLR